MSYDAVFIIRIGLLLVAMAALVAAGLRDVVVRVVPNALAGCLAISGLTLRLLDGTVGTALIAAAAVFLATLLLWYRGWLGGGDVKLLAALALVVPPASIPAMLTAVTVTGALLGIGYMVAGKWVAASRVSANTGSRPNGLLQRAWRAERRRLRRGGPLPYAVAIAAGGLMTVLPAAVSMGA